MRHKRNPLPTLKTKVEDALRLIEIITQNAFPTTKSRRNPYNLKWDLSVVPELDPNESYGGPLPAREYTPALIVAKNVEPAVRKEVLKILFSDDAPFYEAIIKEMEAVTGTPYAYESDDPVPAAWITPKKRARFGKEITEPSELQKVFEDAAKYGDFKSRPDSYEDLESVLRYKKVPVRKRRRY